MLARLTVAALVGLAAVGVSVSAVGVGSAQATTQAPCGCPPNATCPKRPAGAWAPPALANEINPSATDPDIASASTDCDYHFVYPHQGAVDLGLIVFLGGENSWPSEYTLVPSQMAADGFDVLDLSYEYPSGSGVGTTCRNPPYTTQSEIDTCFTQMDGAVAYGSGVSFGPLPPGGYTETGANDDGPNSVMGRTIALLRYLGWDQYLVANSSSPYWGDLINGSNTILAAASEGVDFQAFITHQFAFRGLWSTNGPGETDTPQVTGVKGCPSPPGPVPPAWQSSTVTPAADYAGMVHVQDTGYSCIVPNWSALGYTGPLTALTDNTTVPAGATHQLTTDYGGSCTSNLSANSPHMCLSNDFYTPLSSSKPVFGPAWRFMYMFMTPVTVRTVSLPNPTAGISYTQALSVAGGVAPYTWQVSSGSLPAGLSLSGGKITGTPKSAGTSTFTVEATDSESTPASATQALTLTVDAKSSSFAGYQSPVSGTTTASVTFVTPTLTCGTATPSIASGVNLVAPTATEGGVELSCSGGTASYTPISQRGTTIDPMGFTVSPGDQVTVTVSTSKSSGSVTVTDDTTEATQTIDTAGSAPTAAQFGDLGVSVSGTLQTVPSFGTESFSAATVNGQSLGSVKNTPFQRYNGTTLQIADGAQSPPGSFVTTFKHS